MNRETMTKVYDKFLYIRLPITNHPQNHIKNLIISIIKLKGEKEEKRKTMICTKSKENLCNDKMVTTTGQNKAF